MPILKYANKQYQSFSTSSFWPEEVCWRIVVCTRIHVHFNARPLHEKKLTQHTHTHTPREIINIYFELCCRCVSMFAIFAEVISESALAKLTVSCAAQRERRISHTHSAINQFRKIKRWSERMKRIKGYPMSIIILCSVRDDKFNGFDKYFEYFFSFRLSCASLPDSATGSNSSSNSVGRQMNDDAIRKANHGNATHQQKSFIHLIM